MIGQHLSSNIGNLVWIGILDDTHGWVLIQRYNSVVTHIWRFIAMGSSSVVDVTITTTVAIYLSLSQCMSGREDPCFIYLTRRSSVLIPRDVHDATCICIGICHTNVRQSLITNV